MSERAFKDGYAAGWKWIRGNDEVPAIPACSIPPGETAYQAGVMCGVRDACELPGTPVTKSDGVDSILDRALNRKP
jgi:ribosome modulation factor